MESIHWTAMLGCSLSLQFSQYRVHWLFAIRRTMLCIWSAVIGSNNSVERNAGIALGFQFHAVRPGVAHFSRSATCRLGVQGSL